MFSGIFHHFLHNVYAPIKQEMEIAILGINVSLQNTYMGYIYV